LQSPVSLQQPQHSMSKYKLPAAFAIHVEADPVLQQLKQDGEDNNRPVGEFFKAACAYLLDSRRYLFIELGRYLEKFGPLEPINYETGEPATTEASLEAETEVPEKEFPPLKLVPKPADEEPRKRFTKSYSDDDQS